MKKENVKTKKRAAGVVRDIKLKVGDVVYVRERDFFKTHPKRTSELLRKRGSSIYDIIVNEGVQFTRGMLEYCGKKMKIREIISSDTFTFSDCDWFWNTWMIKPARRVKKTLKKNIKR